MKTPQHNSDSTDRDSRSSSVQRLVRRLWRIGEDVPKIEFKVYSAPAWRPFLDVELEGCLVAIHGENDGILTKARKGEFDWGYQGAVAETLVGQHTAKNLGGGGHEKNLAVRVYDACRDGVLALLGCFKSKPDAKLTLPAARNTLNADSDKGVGNG